MTRRLASLAVLALGGAAIFIGCPPGGQVGRQSDEGEIVRGKDLKDYPTVLSPPILDEPIYECTDTVFVKGFVPGAEVKVFVAGTVAPIGSGHSIASSM